MIEMNEIRSVILEQLGGQMFLAMTGSTPCICSDDRALMVHVGANGTKARWMKVRLEWSDTYTVSFYTRESALIEEFDDVYWDMLQDIFTRVTGMYTKL